MLPILSMKSQALIFLLMSATGFGVGLGYDVLRVFRRVLPHNTIVIQLEDTIFWAVSALAFFYVMLGGNFAEMRVFNILGAALGIILYFCSASRLIMRFAETIIAFVKKAVVFIFKTFTDPFKPIIRKLKIDAKKTTRKCKRKVAVLWKQKQDKKQLKNQAKQEKLPKTKKQTSKQAKQSKKEAH